MKFNDPEFPLTQEQFRLIRQLVNRRFGIALGDEDRYLVESRLTERLQALSHTSFEEYCVYLTGHTDAGDELDRAGELLTTNETYFFREEYQLRAFSSEILPILHKNNRAHRRLMIWSAGCSSGEEVFTIAMMIVDSNLFRGWDVRIFGSDINSRMLARARVGVYPPSAFRSTPPEIMTRHFTREGDNYLVNENIRTMCHFGRLNILDRGRVFFVGRVDAIFCRNMLIYFDKQSRRECLSLLYDRLAPGGYLLLGHSESLLNQETSFEQVHLSEDLVYRRPESANAQDQ